MLFPEYGYRLEDFIEVTSRINSTERLFELFIHVLGGFGFDRVNFSVKYDLQVPIHQRRFGIISTYPADWQQYYIDQNFIDIDPVLRSASALVKPFAWKDLERSHPLTRQQHRFLRLGEEATLHNGLGIPLNGMRSQIAGVALATSTRSQDYMRNRQLLAAFCNQFYATFKRLLGTSSPYSPSMAHLSERETEILQHVAYGLTDEGVADALSMSENTVSYHMKRIFLKLNATNRVQAVVTGLASGLIEF